MRNSTEENEIQDWLGAQTCIRTHACMSEHARVMLQLAAHSALQRAPRTRTRAARTHAIRAINACNWNNVRARTRTRQGTLIRTIEAEVDGIVAAAELEVAVHKGEAVLIVTDHVRALGGGHGVGGDSADQGEENSLLEHVGGFWGGRVAFEEETAKE